MKNQENHENHQNPLIFNENHGFSMKTIDFLDFHETLAYSETTRASKIFSENVVGIGYHSNMSRKSIPSVFEVGMSDKHDRNENLKS